jgi:hypothetical protein
MLDSPHTQSPLAKTARVVVALACRNALGQGRVPEYPFALAARLVR